MNLPASGSCWQLVAEARCRNRLLIRARHRDASARALVVGLSSAAGVAWVNLSRGGCEDARPGLTRCFLRKEFNVPAAGGVVLEPLGEIREALRHGPNQ